MINTQIGGKVRGLDRGAKIVQLESKGQSIQFRLASGQMSYDAKHFMKTEDNKWEVTSCPKIMKEQDCAYCEKCDEARSNIVEFINEKKSQGLEIKDIKKLDEYETLNAPIKKYEPKFEFYYLILNREEEALQAFQTTLMIRIAIDNKAKQLEKIGGNIMDYDLIATRTEQPGSYYTLDQVDSALSAPLTETELALLEEAKTFDLSGMLNKKNSSKNLEDEKKEKDATGTENVTFEELDLDKDNPNGPTPF